MNIGALIIGDELLSGKRQDQHFNHLQSVLAQRGLELSWTIMVGDEPEQLERFLGLSLSTKDLVFSFGGIGATPDDRTRQTVARVANVDLEPHPQATAEIEAKTKVEVFELLKKSIRTEFLNRIDEIMMFKPLSRLDIRGIVDVQFKVLKRMLENQGVEITASNEALDWLSEIGYDPQFGARPLKRAIQREVLNKLSIKILDSTITTDSNIKLDVNEKKEFVFENSK